MARLPAPIRQDTRDAALKALLASLEQVRARPEEFLVCSACSHPVTTLGQRVEIEGAHLHRCFNPTGIGFDLACFQEAWGTSTLGEATDYFSWFQGFAWQVVTCEECCDHLGWYYQAENHYFYGLIIQKLRSRR